MPQTFDLILRGGTVVNQDGVGDRRLCWASAGGIIDRRAAVRFGEAL